MGRLTKQFESDFGHLGHKDCYGACAMCDVVDFCNMVEEMLIKLAHYEDLEEQGRLIELPCKVGDTVWSLDLDIHWIEYFKVTYITVTEHGIGIENPYFGYGFDVKDLGDTVFLTKEEAEAKLKEMKGEQE